MKKLSYLAVVAVILCFGGAVAASSLGIQDPIPSSEQVASYINQAHVQDQNY
jgi:hypothetical protein